MSIIWADGFDHQGALNANLVASGYSNLHNTTAPSLVNPRTGLYCLPAQNYSLGRTLDAALSTVGVGIGFRLGGSPDARATGIRFMDAANNPIAYATFNPTGGIELNLGAINFFADKSFVKTNNNAFGFNAWHHLELKFGIGAINGQGYFGLKLNGELLCEGNNLSAGVTQVSKIGLNLGANVNNPPMYDDLVIWDTNGAVNNDWLGDRRCFTSFPTADIGLQQWTPVGDATAFGAIDNVPPDAAKYIQSNASGDVSEFSKSGLSVLATGVAGVRLVGQMMKTDAGAASARLGIKSGAFVTNGPSKTPGTTMGYFDTIIEADPNGGGAFTKTSFEAASFRVTKD